MAALVRFKAVNGVTAWVDPDQVVAVLGREDDTSIWLTGGHKVAVSLAPEKVISLLNLQFGGAAAE